MLLLIQIFIVLAVLALAYGVNQAFVEVPSDDRTFLDPPPPWYRATWPLVLLIAFRLGPLLGISYRHKLQQRLRLAGLDYGLSPEQFFAGKVLTALGAVGILILLLLPRGGPGKLLLVVVGVLAFFFPDLWLRDQRNYRERQILKVLPFYLDVITLCVESGLNLTGAMTQAVAKTPPSALKNELNRVLRDIRAGRPRAESLRAMSERLQMPAISNVVSALNTADRQGANLGPILRAQAEQRRNERFLRAEKLAMEAPVKMLFPLIAFIFPCTFAVIAFPIVMKFMEEGLLR